MKQGTLLHLLHTLFPSHSQSQRPFPKRVSNATISHLNKSNCSVLLSFFLFLSELVCLFVLFLFVCLFLFFVFYFLFIFKFFKRFCQFFSVFFGLKVRTGKGRKDPAHPNLRGPKKKKPFKFFIYLYIKGIF